MGTYIDANQILRKYETVQRAEICLKTAAFQRYVPFLTLKRATLGSQYKRIAAFETNPVFELY
ncbi:hypothetical protein ALO43_200049 [Pseudomonas tremae]|uniref:Uncharacterized protein n=1 Tax=Pseudomonas tremae TaxID=200454 RepID=A0AA40TW17_9PSED|nr:hypothetical protein ALO43_200049 [Pseudomonas tremae]